MPNLKKITALSIITATAIMASGDIAPVEPQVEAVVPVVKEDTFIKTVEGYVRVGYQYTDIDGDKGYTDLAAGGKLKVTTKSFYGISGGLSFSISDDLDIAEGNGVPFFDHNNNTYSIMDEAYIQGEWGNTNIKIGRVMLDTPFANANDIGMMPNTFKAGVLTNTDLPDTTITLAQIQAWHGVDLVAAQMDGEAAIDPKKPSKFIEVNGSNNVQVLGIAYEGVENLALSGWYYYLKDAEIDGIAYVDANYEGLTNGFNYALGTQYALQNYSAAGADNASIIGVHVSAGLESAGLTLGAAYNKSSDNAAINGFGRGPFYTNLDHLSLAEAGIDGEALMITAKWDVSVVGAKGLTLSTRKLTLEDINGVEGDELDIVARYAWNDDLSIDAIYSDVDDEINGEKFNNTRVFVNYRF